MNQYTQAVEPGWQSHEFCFLNEKRLEEVARKLAGKKFETPSWRLPVFPEADDEIFINFLGVANALNYCFTDPNTGGKFRVLYPEDSDNTWDGAFGMFASIRRAMDEGLPILERDFLRDITLSDVVRIFRPYGWGMPMMEQRTQSLRSLAFTMKQLCIKNFSELFTRCDFYAFSHEGKDGIVDLLASSFSQYYDVQVDSAKNVLPFHKRAQLLVMIYHGRALASDGALQPIRDAHKIGPLADYQVPNALRTLGILKYCEELANRVDMGWIVEKNSQEEIEIRAQTVHAMCRLLDEINVLRRKNHIKKITMVELDYVIWRMGRESKLKHHRTFTTAY